jgi:hypothetical protein
MAQIDRDRTVAKAISNERPGCSFTETDRAGCPAHLAMQRALTAQT